MFCAALMLFLELAQPGLAAPQEEDAAARRTAQIERHIERGDVDALRALIGAGATPDDLLALARAQTIKAAGIREAEARNTAFAAAQRFYEQWIAALERARDFAPQIRTVSVANATAQLAEMILARWLTVDLDEYEISAGRQGDRERITRLLTLSRDLSTRARERIAPLIEELATGGQEVEDRFLYLGVYDTLRTLELQIDFNLAWANLYLGMLTPESDQGRRAALSAAESRFLGLMDTTGDAATEQRVLLGLGVALREQGRHDEAVRHLTSAMQSAGAAHTARVRCELARTHFAAGRFPEGRETLRPMVERDAEQLTGEEAAARFYFNLAQVWYAYSFLLEAQEAAPKPGAPSAVGDAQRVAATRAREAGLLRFNRLAARGGSWPALVALFVSSEIAPDADPAKLTTVELLFAGRRYSGEKRFREALRFLDEAIGRKDIAREALGDALFEKAVCHYRLGEVDPAATAFASLATKLPNHAQAAEALSHASQLLARLAKDSEKPADYARLAELLTVLVEQFPQHPQHRDATWWLPQALQSAERYEDAAARFARIPPESAHFHEARFRRALCLRLALVNAGDRLGVAERKRRAERAVTELLSVARSLLETGDPATLAARRDWSAQATLYAAELQAGDALVQPEQSLATLADFEKLFPDHTLAGRVLATRLRAYRALKRFDEGAKVVEAFVKAAPAAQAAPVLATMAAGMQDEVQRLLAENREAEARQLASDAIGVFEQLLALTRTSDVLREQATPIRIGLARMHLTGGNPAAALALAEQLVASNPGSGDALHLQALALTAQLAPAATADAVAAVRDAWGKLLSDSALRETSPDIYWEARLNYLSLLLREGKAEDVERAIRSERVWNPQLGGRRWEPQLRTLYERALDAGARPPAP